MNISFVQSEAHKLSPSVAKCVSDNAQLLEQVTREIRTLSHLLHPPLLDEAGLAPRYAGTSKDLPIAAKLM